MIVTTRAKPSAAAIGLAWDGSRLWAGDFEARSLSALSSAGDVEEKYSAPGRPVWLCCCDTRLAAVISHPETDNRSIHFFDRASRTWLEHGLRCPDDTGSQLAWDGGHLRLGQRYNKVILQLHADGTVKHAIEVTNEVTGLYWIGATVWLNLRVEQGFSDGARRGPGASRPS